MAITAYSQKNLWQRIQARQGDYETRRELYDAQRSAIVELTRPDLVTGKVGSKTEGAFSSSKIVEGTAPHAVQVWQRGFQGNMMSRKAEWFRERAKEPPRWTGVRFKGNDEVNQYCQDLADAMNDAYRRSNYYDVMPQFVLDGGTVGSPTMLFEEDVYNDRVICKVPDYAAVWIDRDIFGYDNALHVKWEWNALEAEAFFGEDQLPKKVLNDLGQGHFYVKRPYLQVIYGAGDRIYRNLPEADQVWMTHPWLEHFICLAAASDEQKVLKPLNKGPGYFVRPFATWHYHRNWSEVYSRTMAWWAIYDIRAHNAMWEALFGEAELSVRPPSWAPAAMRGLLDLSPGGDNWPRNREEYEQPPIFLDRKTRYDVAVEFTDRVAASARRWFHYDLWMLVNEIMRTKTQPESVYGLMRAEAEKTGQLAPQVESYETQVLGHAHDIFMDMELRAEPAYPWGRLPEPPMILQQYSDGEVDVEFIGMLSLAMQRDRQTLKTLRTLSGVDMFMQLNPNVVYKIRADKALERFLEAEDFTQADIVPDEEYQEIMDTLEQRALQQQLAEAAPKLTQAAKNLQDKTEKGSPLGLLTGAAK